LQFWRSEVWNPNFAEEVLSVSSDLKRIAINQLYEAVRCNEYEIGVYIADNVAVTVNYSEGCGSVSRCINKKCPILFREQLFSMARPVQVMYRLMPAALDIKKPRIGPPRLPCRVLMATRQCSAGSHRNCQPWHGVLPAFRGLCVRGRPWRQYHVPTMELQRLRLRRPSQASYQEIFARPGCRTELLMTETSGEYQCLIIVSSLIDLWATEET
jgi:hypothetical protein